MTRLGDQCTASVQRLMPDAFSSYTRTVPDVSISALSLS
jgi:hypothetical protein